VTLNTVGPTIMTFGDDEQKQFFLAGILAGDIHFAIGYTEPEAGTDLASLRTRAVRDGDEYVIDGGKVFTSGANDADYIWLACRPNPMRPSTRGSPSSRCPPRVPDSAGRRSVPSAGPPPVPPITTTPRPGSARIGPENEGWRMITNQLNTSGGVGRHGRSAHRLWDEVVAWARATPAGDGSDRPVIDLRGCRPIWPARTPGWPHAAAHCGWRASRSRRSARPTPRRSRFTAPNAWSSLPTLSSVLGVVGSLRPGSPGAILGGQIELMSRSAQINTFGGGVNDVQREIVASAGLGMVRRKREAQ